MSKMHFIDWIWTARGELKLDPPLTPVEAFERLEPLLDAASVAPSPEEGVLTYRKYNPAAQDKLATFSSGRLAIREEDGQSHLLYDLKSPALRLVFLAPLFFLAIAQGTEILSDYERERQEQKGDAKDKEEDKEDEELQPMNPIDAFLGAPEPLSLEEKRRRKEEEEAKDKHSSTPAYVFAGIFATLWLLGRFLEPWLVRRTFLRALFPDRFPEEPLLTNLFRSLASWFKSGPATK